MERTIAAGAELMVGGFWVVVFGIPRGVLCMHIVMDRWSEMSAPFGPRRRHREAEVFSNAAEAPSPARSAPRNALAQLGRLFEGLESRQGRGSKS